MKRFLSVLLVIILSISVGSSTYVTTKDRIIYAASMTEEGSLEWMISQNILNEKFDVEEIKKSPNRIITRQEFIGLLLTVLKAEGTAEDFDQLTYQDKSKVKDTLRGDIAAANKLGILMVKKKGKKQYIKPDHKLTRRMSCYYLGMVTGMNIPLDAEKFEDYEKVGDPTQYYVSGVIASGITDWEMLKSLEPKKYVTWKEAGKLIQNAYKQGYFQTIKTEVHVGEASTGATLEGGELESPIGLVKSADQNMYLVDQDQNVIKRIDQNKKLSIAAGRLNEKDGSGIRIGGYVDGKATEAMFNQPYDLCAVKNGILVSDSGNHSIRFINLITNRVETLAGNGTLGYKNGVKNEVRFNNPQGIDISLDGNIYVADTGNHCIRKINANGTVSLLAGIPGLEEYQDGTAEKAAFNSPTHVLCDGNKIYVSDMGNQRIRKIENGIVTTLAGSGTEKEEGTNNYVGGFWNGEALRAQFDGPGHMAIDSEGVIYVSDINNHMIRYIKNGEVGTVAGYGHLITDKKEEWNNKLYMPTGLYVSSKDKKLYVTDMLYQHVLQITLPEKENR